MTSFEKRKFRRIKVNFIVVYRVDKPLHLLTLIAGKEARARMFDLSEEGMSILTNYNIPVSSALLIKFTLVNPYASAEGNVDAIELKGEVRYNVLEENGDRRLGIHFTDISGKDREVIDRLVSKTPQ